MHNRRRWFGVLAAALALSLLVAGCASTDTVKKARGEGAKRLYRDDQKVVHAAILAVAKNRNFDVVENSPNAVLLSTGLSWRSFGEHIAVFLRTVSPRLTEVEVVSKPVMGAWNFPRDWEIALLEEIGRSLAPPAPAQSPSLPSPASPPSAPAPAPRPR